MVTQTHNTQRSAASILDHHISPATIARELQELADAFLAMGDRDLEPTLLSVGLHVVGTGTERSSERVESVALIAGQLGMRPKLSDAATAGLYDFHAGTFLSGPKIFTVIPADYPPAGAARSADSEPGELAPMPLAVGAIGDVPADLKAVAAVCCGQIAASSFEVYTPREGEARGRLDGAVYVCNEHPREVAAAARAQGLVPYLVPLSRHPFRGRPGCCGDGYDYVAGQGFNAPAVEAAVAADSPRGALAVTP